jgi:hypothetical protein
MRRGGVKSFVDDLVLGRGVVISRAATSLRTVETQPWTRRFVRTLDEHDLRYNVQRLVVCLNSGEGEPLLLVALPIPAKQGLFRVSRHE